MIGVRIPAGVPNGLVAQSEEQSPPKGKVGLGSNPPGITKTANIKESIMDIGSGTKYPAGALSNFSPHPFEIDGVKCNSMEGLLQSLKFESVEMQEHVCTLVGIKAKSKGRKKKWFRTQTLHWRGTVMPRDSQEYQDLLDRAYDALAENTKFQKALLASGDAVLKHSIGKKSKNETVLTKREFCSRLTTIRERLKKEKENAKG